MREGLIDTKQPILPQVLNLLARIPKRIIFSAVGFFFFLTVLISSLRSRNDNYITSARDYVGTWSAVDYFDVPFNNLSDASHPIDQLIHAARDSHEEKLLAKQTFNLTDALDAYRERRGRHPPPGFDAWFDHAMQMDAVVVEDFFDRIYDDLRPFHAVEPKELAEMAAGRSNVIRIRNGHVHMYPQDDPRPNDMTEWYELITEISLHLPDMDIPVNALSQPRVAAPWEEVQKMLAVEEEKRVIVDKDEVEPKNKELAIVEIGESAYNWMPIDFQDTDYWNLLTKACPPESPARAAEAPAIDKNGAPSLPYTWNAPFAHGGFVSNWTGALDHCQQPHLRQLHSAYADPHRVNVTSTMIPMFSGGKLGVNNDILIPATAYLKKNEDAKRIAKLLGRDWESMEDKLRFHGIGSAGDKHSPWKYYQRHRLVEMLNGTSVHDIEVGAVERGMSFDFPPESYYDSKRRHKQKLGYWLEDFASSGFSLFACEGGEETHLTREPCERFNAHEEAIEGGWGNGATPIVDDFNAKFMPVVDRDRSAGGPVAAKFRTIMLSSAVPLRSTAVKEWHDDRLVPWLHYIPLDTTLRDLYPILDFFTDADGGHKGDQASLWIAESGRDWAKKVLRREDMRLYTWRLLLEWGRLCDKNREQLGYVTDIFDRGG